MECTNLKSSDGYELELHIFKCENPKGTFMVIHGMEEHQKRYENLALYLNERGYNVVTADMRGHGENAPLLGYFKDKKGYKYLIDDELCIYDYISKNIGGPISLFAHSMGTIIARVLLQSHSDKFDKVILSGFPNPQKAAVLGIMVSNVLQRIKGPKGKSKLLTKLSMGSFNKAIKNPKTKIDWLSYDEQNIREYIADPFCGCEFKISAYNDLFHLVKDMGNHKKYTAVNSELPLLLLGGKDDPCLGNEKGIDKSLQVLIKAGFKNVQLTIFDHMRHEILNEINNAKVYQEIEDFLKK